MFEKVFDNIRLPSSVKSEISKFSKPLAILISRKKYKEAVNKAVYISETIAEKYHKEILAQNKHLTFQSTKLIVKAKACTYSDPYCSPTVGSVLTSLAASIVTRQLFSFIIKTLLTLDILKHQPRKIGKVFSNKVIQAICLILADIVIVSIWKQSGSLCVLAYLQGARGFLQGKLISPKYYIRLILIPAYELLKAGKIDETIFRALYIATTLVSKV